MSNKAHQLFTAVPRQHNCAQAVAAGTGREELVSELSAYGGGRAPEGLCGALYSALQITDPAHHESLKQEFAAAAGALTCREIKSGSKYPCSECVRTAADLVEKYR